MTLAMGVVHHSWPLYKNIIMFSSPKIIPPINGQDLAALLSII